MVKQEVILKCKQLTKEISIEKNKKQDELQTKLQQLQAEAGHRNSEELLAKLEEVQEKLDVFFHEKVQGAIFRSRAQWYHEGEKNSRYFFQLEKSRFRSRSISRLMKQTNDYTQNSQEALCVAFDFYSNLYGSYKKGPFTVPNVYEKKVSAEHIESLHFKTLELRDIGAALAKFKNNKTPGCDGLPAEFYKIFWNKLKNPLCEYYNKALIERGLGWSATKGVLSLIRIRI